MSHLKSYGYSGNIKFLLVKYMTNIKNKNSLRVCFFIEESLNLKSISMHSLCLYLVFMLVSAKFPLLERYIVENGSNCDATYHMHAACVDAISFDHER